MFIAQCQIDMDYTFLARRNEFEFKAQKFAGESISIRIDWSKVIDGSTISTSTWSMSQDLTETQASDIDGRYVSAYVSGGNNYSVYYYTLKNTITTSASRTFIASVVLKVNPDPVTD